MVTETIPPNATLPQLRTVMERCVDQAEELVKTAEAANGGKGRSFTDDEQGDFDALRDTITQCRQRIDAKDFLADQTKSRGRKTPVEPIKDGGGDPSLRRATRSGNSGGVGQRGWKDQHGMEVRALANDEKLVDLVAETRGRRFEGLRLGNLVRASVTGDPSFAADELRAMSTGNNPSAGYLVPDALSAQVIDLARSQAVIFSAGAVTVPITGNNMRMARLIADATIETKSESATFAGSDISFDALMFVPKTIGVLVRSSRELAQDAPNYSEIIEQSIAKAIAAKLDNLAINGTGTLADLNILGLKGNNPNPVTSVGTPTNWTKWLDAWEAVLTDNAVGPFSYVLHPRDAGTLLGLQEATTNGYLIPPAPIREAKQFITTTIAVTDGGGSNESSSYFGDFTQMLVGVRQDILIEATTEGESAFEKHQVLVKATVRVDINFAHIDHFSRLSGITSA